MVRLAGVEPVRVSPLDPKSNVSTIPPQAQRDYYKRQKG